MAFRSAGAAGASADAVMSNATLEVEGIGRRARRRRDGNARQVQYPTWRRYRRLLTLCGELRARVRRGQSHASCREELEALLEFLGLDGGFVDSTVLEGLEYFPGKHPPNLHGRGGRSRAGTRGDARGGSPDGGGRASPSGAVSPEAVKLEVQAAMETIAGARRQSQLSFEARRASAAMERRTSTANSAGSQDGVKNAAALRRQSLALVTGTADGTSLAELLAAVDTITNPAPKAEAADADAGPKGPYAEAREKVYETLSEPSSGRLAWLISVVILVCILISSTTFCMETMEQYTDEESTAVFADIEIAVIVVFTLEYSLKLATCPRVWEFVRAPLNVIDLLAIIPFYLELLMKLDPNYDDSSDTGASRILRVIRLVRVFRVLKLGGKFGKIQVVAKAVTESADMLAMLFFLLLLTVVLFSTLIHYAELNEKWTDPCSGLEIANPFHSIPASFWWCMVTLMTVGYGDSYPLTWGGQILGILTMIVSVVIMALPISVIGANFTHQWMLFKEEESKSIHAQKVLEVMQSVEDKLSIHSSLLKEMASAMVKLNIISTFQASAAEKAVTDCGQILDLHDAVEATEEDWANFESRMEQTAQAVAKLRLTYMDMEVIISLFNMISSATLDDDMGKIESLALKLGTLMEEVPYIKTELECVDAEVQELKLLFNEAFRSLSVILAPSSWRARPPPPRRGASSHRRAPSPVPTSRGSDPTLRGHRESAASRTKNALLETAGRPPISPGSAWPLPLPPLFYYLKAAYIASTSAL